MRRRRRPVLALALLVGSLVAVGAVDAATPPPAERGPARAVAEGTEARSGRAVCAVGDARPGARLAVDVARPGRTGEPPAEVALQVLEHGSTRELATARLFPGAAVRTALDEGEQAAVDVRWSQAPVGVHRTWRLDGEQDLPRGTAAGPCVPTTAPTTWTVPGLTTAGGHEARLRLANPHPTGATVAVTFLTPDGPDAPTRLRNVSVGPSETLELELNEYAPEQLDLGAVVEVLSGRVAVEGYQLTRSAIGGIDGVSLLAAATEPAETWTVPWVVDGGEQRTSWLWIANTSDRSAPVELTVHTDEGGVVPDGLAEVSVPPGTVRRIDLRGTLPEDSRAITARSDGVPVTVSGVVRIAADDVEDTGFAVQLGAAADELWSLAGGSTAGRAEQLRLINPGSEPATVDVTLWNGTTATQPPELTAIEVPAGALVTVQLAELLGEVPSWAATVRASGGTVVAASVGSGRPSGHRELVATVGAPSSWWRTADAPPLRFAPGTTQRLGTELGIEPVDPLAPEDGADSDDAVAPTDAVPDAGAPDVVDDGAGTTDGGEVDPGGGEDEAPATDGGDGQG